MGLTRESSAERICRYIKNMYYVLLGFFLRSYFFCRMAVNFMQLPAFRSSTTCKEVSGVHLGACFHLQGNACSQGILHLGQLIGREFLSRGKLRGRVFQTCTIWPYGSSLVDTPTSNRRRLQGRSDLIHRLGLDLILHVSGCCGPCQQQALHGQPLSLGNLAS